ncbi:cell wall synthase accessory phosphoprotein MacP [Streptococcus macacae]|uniref:Foldase n=1 Tax=Streptococcus macacae NCTC 11558 TaxID=764298 RepID=G5JYF9_9STRE|nr:cell wall synthase accessory phosphoprotein MacP [Streptococcus macacae]EHJ52185.1 hypothetical protein STRMA_0220 [Streptococcus macacae NCTC 11558]SUN78072.1 membrane protein [Streptococcus macacae NCTC 11558]
MSKPLLTDEMIARANRGEKLDDYHKGIFDSEETIVISTDHYKSDWKQEEDRNFRPDFDVSDDYDYDEPMVKSRRIENAKRGEFRTKLNWILLGIALLLAILIYAVFKL